MQLKDLEFTSCAPQSTHNPSQSGTCVWCDTQKKCTLRELARQATRRACCMVMGHDVCLLHLFILFLGFCLLLFCFLLYDFFSYICFVTVFFCMFCSGSWVAALSLLLYNVIIFRVVLAQNARSRSSLLALLNDNTPRHSSPLLIRLIGMPGTVLLAALFSANHAVRACEISALGCLLRGSSAG